MDSSLIDRIIATERRRHRWRTFWSLAGLVALFGGCAITLLSERGVLPILRAYPGSSMAAGWLLAVIILAISFPLTRPPEGSHRPEVLQRQIETYQGRYRNWLLILGSIAALLASLESFFPGLLPGWFTPPHYAMNWFITLYTLAVLHALLSARRRPYLEIPGDIDFNDELLHEIRLKASRIGLVTVMAALAATYLWILYHPGDASLILPWILAGGVAVPAAAFCVLHARAGKNEP